MNPESRESRPPFEVAEATREDAERIAWIQRESWIATYPNAEAGVSIQDVRQNLGNPITSANRWRRQLDQPRERIRTFVVKENGRVIGFCEAKKDEHENFVNALYLDPSYKGTGAGSAVFKAALAWLGEDKPTSLEVASYNDRAMDFYKRFGFEEAGEAPPYELVPGKTMPLTAMRRS